MEVKLKIVGGKNAGQEIAVPGPKFVIGRATGCQLRAKSEQIAERHCEIEIAPALVVVRDFGSSNGTLVNGERVSGQREMKTGDKLRVGPLEFDVFITTGLATKKKPKVAGAGEAAARMAAGKKQDLDVTQWLGNDEDETARSREALTHEEMVALGLAPAGASSETSPEAQSDTPPEAKSATDDTRQVAADMLNKYFKRR
jgi:pSer/pThr/pTyr-binding forkhead associated (FHA) protein